MDIRESIQYEQMRSDCFRLLAACFYQPDKKLFDEVKLFANLTASLQKVCPAAAEYSSVMEKEFPGYSSEDLTVAYTKLFVGPYHLIAPPYGSVYLDEGKRVMGDSTMEVIRTYQSEGLSKSEDFKDLPDHIAVELEFMSYLIYKEIKELEQSALNSATEITDKQELFLNTFLRRWVPQFSEEIKKGTDNKFYIALADCTNFFIMQPQLLPDLFQGSF